jgi:alpha-galactosidase
MSQNYCRKFLACHVCQSNERSVNVRLVSLTPPFDHSSKYCEHAARLRIAVVLSAVLTISLVFSTDAQSADFSARNEHLSCIIRDSDGSYSIYSKKLARPIIRGIVGAEINHRWVKSPDYPRHEVAQSEFHDVLGHGRQFTVVSSGLARQPDLKYVLRLYDGSAFADIQVELINRTTATINVQNIRNLEALGKRPLDLGGDEAQDRVLSDSFSENRPALQIRDLEEAPNGLHQAVGSQLIYNRDSKQSLFVGAVSSARFLTILRLEVRMSGNTSQIGSYTVDSTGTTEIQTSYFPDAPAGENRIELSLPLLSGGTIKSERVMFAEGADYHAQLEAYGTAIRKLHHARVSSGNLMGWWSWTAFYRNITQRNIFDNAQWLADHLTRFGYEYIHCDAGYESAPGEYTNADTGRFPEGMKSIATEIRNLGLKVGIWTAPFYIGERAWVYKRHKEWLVHNAKGKPIRILKAAHAQEAQDIFVLDPTHPGAQKYLRRTFRTLVQQWKVHYIKLDFMDSTAVEGYHYRPHTTALEAQRIGLLTIRKAVGEDVLLDKDGSPMLNPVGLVDEGRISQDTAHTFVATKNAATGIAARYYMNRNFFITDPDAFNISRQMVGQQIQAPLTLQEAQVSLALAAVSGGMFEIGDDLPTLGSDPERLALLTNSDLIHMVKLGRASTPIDLLNYRRSDGQPSIFLLRINNHESILTIFNWTEEIQNHRLKLSDLNLPTAHDVRLYDVLDQHPIDLASDGILMEIQPPHSVRMIKIVRDVQQRAPSNGYRMVGGH